jgi:hypothetical protein
MPYRLRAEALLARWREAERRHASTAPGTPEFEQTRIEIDDVRRQYQQAVEAVEALEQANQTSSMPVPQPAD